DVWRLRFVAGTPEWTPMQSLGTINSWRGGSMFWDPGRQRILLYAKQQFGFEIGATVVPTVFEWTGTSFVPIDYSIPSLRRFAAMGPTSESGDIRMFGGLRVSDSAILGDTWAFNGEPAPAFPGGVSGTGEYESGSTVTVAALIVVGTSPDLLWYRDGVALADGVTASGSVISGSQTRTLVIANVRPGDAGLYRCRGTNACGSDESSGALVQVTVRCPADFNGDLFVDDSDFVIFAEAYNLLDCADPSMPAGCPADLTLDGFVDDSDFVAFASAYELLLCP
ncbi:MAG: immunoglobulin domain-containing protein, partial [Phycisphaerae bacterium]